MFFQLHCGYQNYDWGKIGYDSLVAQFAAAPGDVKIDENEPYAELWMGSHPKVCSKPLSGGYDSLNLREIVDMHPEALGKRVISEFGGGELPYLFKVLSIRKALSIQAHPDKALGKILHARDPKNYPDDNHKPEMAIALTDFEGFCGFRPLHEIAGFIRTVPEFRQLVGGDEADKFLSSYENDPKGSLRNLFSAVMHADDAAVGVLAPLLANRAAEETDKFAGGAEAGAGASLASLLVRVDKQFPKDIGLFCGGLMLNYVILKKGEAMFLRAKDPHAYISGDIIECMAASDNVVRAGFTPKFKDVETLVDMLTYNSGTVADQKMIPKPFPPASGGVTKLFEPPIDEFSVLQQHSVPGEKAHLGAIGGPTILIMTEGTGTIRADDQSLEYKPGFVYFAGAGTAIDIEAKTESWSYHAIVDV